KPLAFHVVTALEEIPFCARIAIVSDTRLDFGERGYRVVENSDPSLGQVRSLCHGVTAAKEAECDYVLVALADMPRVTALHICGLLGAANGPYTSVASSDGVRAMGQALFGSGRFDELLEVDGDVGAQELIKSGRHVITTPAE